MALYQLSYVGFNRKFQRAVGFKPTLLSDALWPALAGFEPAKPTR
jgi:hypothetical protein